MTTRHPYASPDGFGGGVHHTQNQKATIKAFDKFYSWFPAFLDIFPDEEAFLNFAFWFFGIKIHQDKTLPGLRTPTQKTYIVFF